MHSDAEGNRYVTGLALADARLSMFGFVFCHDIFGLVFSTQRLAGQRLIETTVVTRVVRTMLRANQLRLWLSSMAYVLISALRRIALATTRFADATCGTIRLQLFKIGAQVS